MIFPSVGGYMLKNIKDIYFFSDYSHGSYKT